MKKLILFFCIVGLCSCSRQTATHVYTSFKTTDTLVAQVHSIPPVMLYPRGLFLDGSRLVVFNDKMDTCFQVFDRNDFRYLYSFGVLGEGPEDFQLPVGQFAGQHAGKTFVTDMDKLKSISFESGKPVISVHPLPVQRSYYNGLMMLADSLYVCEADHEDSKEYIFIHPDGSQEQKVDYPETEERFGSVLARNQAYERLTAARPSGECFASFYVSDRRFRIIDRSGNILHDILLDIAPRDPQIPVASDERRIHTLSVYATQDHIYTLNLDMKPEEIYNRKCLPSIQVFSWEGTPLAQWFLDRLVSSFVVDEDRRIIYGVFAENEAEIYTFGWGDD